MTQTLNITLARSQLSDLAARVFRGESRIIIQKSGIPVAALVSLPDLERLALLEARQQEGFAVMDQMRASFADVSPAELERQLRKALDQTRAASAAPDSSPTHG